MSTALQRAVKAILEASADGVAPFYVYAEHDGDGGAASFQTRGEAQQAFDTATTFAYAALFDSSDPAWPDPVAQHAPSQTSVAGRGSSGHHGHMASAIEYGSTASTTDTHAGADAPLDPWAATAGPAAPAAPQIPDRPPNVNEQTDQMFYEAHPELWNAQVGQYRRLDPRRAEDAGLMQEWLVYRDFIVTAQREMAADQAARAARQPHNLDPGGAIASAAQMISSGDPTMNSNDPWRVMEGVPPGARMIVPRQTHPMVLGWPHFGKLYGHERRTPSGWGKYRSKRKGVVLDVAPVLHPAQDVQVVLTELDPDNVLHVAITVDAKHSYRAAVDLNKAIAVVMHKLAQWHRHEHERMGRRALVGADPSGAINAAVGTAATALIGKLLDDHVAAVCGGWLDDIGNALGHAADAVGGALQSTVRALKGPITAAANAALSSIPIIGPMAAPIADKLIAAAAGNPAAAQQVQQIKAAAAQNPQTQQALNLAQQKAAQATAAAHVAVTAQAAQQGNPAAQAQLANAQQAAAAGDPAAQQVAQMAAQAQASPGASPSQLLAQLLGALGVQPGQPPPPPVYNQGASYAPSPAGAACIDFCTPASCGPTVSGYAVLGAAVDSLRSQASARASASAGQGGALLVVLDGSARGGYVRPYDSADDADDQFGRLDPKTFLYAAYYDEQDPTFPAPLADRVGTIVQQTPAVSGVAALPALFGLGLGAGGMAAWDRRAAIKAWLTGQQAA